jgi:hypothetical protein
MSCTGIRTRKLFLFLGTAATTENGVNILLTQSNNFTGNVNLTCNVAYQGTGAVNALPLAPSPLTSSRTTSIVGATILKCGEQGESFTEYELDEC